MQRQNYLVRFAEAIEHDPNVSLIAISPRDRRWNDFGYNFLGRLTISPADGRERIQLDACVIPVDSNGSPVRFPDWFDVRFREVKRPFAVKKSGFVTLLSSDDAYVKLFEWCRDADEYGALLFEINEISWAIQHRTFDERVLKGLVRSEAFRLGVIRSPGAYRAFRSGYEVGMRLTRELADARVPFDVAVSLSGFSTPHRLNVTYVETTLLEDRLHCVIGPNGVGKSRFLRSLVLGLSHISGVEDNPFLDVPLDEYRAAVSKFAHSGVPAFSRVLAYGAELDSALPGSIRSDSEFDYQWFSLIDRPESYRHILVDADSRQSMTMARMLVDLLRGTEDVGTFNRLGALKAAISPHLDWSCVAIPLRTGSVHDVAFESQGRPWVRFSVLQQVNEERRLNVAADFDDRAEVSFFDYDGERINVSSGQWTFLRFALHFLSYASRGSLIIVDEPETHLHPNMISSFAVLLYRVLVQTKSVAIVATHSPFVVREAPTHCVHVFRRSEGGSVSTEKVYLRTLGASPTSISLAVFGDDTSRKYSQDLIVRACDAKGSLKEVLEEYGELLSPDLILYVRHELDRRAQEGGP